MRDALICAVLLPVFAAAQTVEKPTTGGTNSGAPAQAAGTGPNSPSGALGGASSSGLGLQGVLGGVPGSPAPTPGARTPAAAGQVPSGSALPITAGATPRSAAPEAASASSVLDAAARGVKQGQKAEAASGGEGPAVRRELDRAYDAAARKDDAGGAPGVAGKSAGGKVARLVGLANNETMANAPSLYLDAIKAAEELPSAAAAADAVGAVRASAARKVSEASLSGLVQAAFDAAAAGRAPEARRLVQSLGDWEKTLGAPGRPLISNGERVGAGVERALSAASKFPEAKGPPAPRVWVARRGASYAAFLPGAPVEKVPGLAVSFALELENISLAPMADAYRAFAAAPGALPAARGRAATGESIPSAALSRPWLWLKYLVMRVWNALADLLAARRLPAVANASTMPRLREAARAWRDAVGLGGAAARAALAPRPTVSRARGAFALARRAAAAHEALTGDSGAVSRIESLASEFEAGVKRFALSPDDRLNFGLQFIVSGDGGLGHWASRHAADARERGGAALAKVRGPSPVVVLDEGSAAAAAAALAAAAKGLSVAASGDALWASGPGVELSADLRSTESGGSIALKTERGGETLAAALDRLGFSVARAGSGLRATLDAQSATADAREMAELAADGAALLAGASLPEGAVAPGGLERLLADVRRAPKEAARAAASLDGRPWPRERLLGWVEDDEAVSTEFRSRGVRVIALRDPATRLLKFARIEPLRAR
ncbi:MAG: hypothetical protein HY403_09985 [Elusimicrobia bacterium]|nr:hypothetical protein [Elusimicrobiota bacterium]